MLPPDSLTHKQMSSRSEHRQFSDAIVNKEDSSGTKVSIDINELDKYYAGDK